MRKSGFTLIELVMVIVILAIIASVTLPKFVNFKTESIEKTEDQIIGALKTAIQITHMSYVTQGLEASWPGQVGSSIFSLVLTQTPPNKPWPGWPNCDGVNWVYQSAYSGYYYIFCPHWNGEVWGGSPQAATKGRYYLYQYLDIGWYPPHKPGDFWLASDMRHTYQ